MVPNIDGLPRVTKEGFFGSNVRPLRLLIHCQEYYVLEYNMTPWEHETPLTNVWGINGHLMMETAMGDACQVGG